MNKENFLKLKENIPFKIKKSKRTGTSTNGLNIYIHSPECFSKENMCSLIKDTVFCFLYEEKIKALNISDEQKEALEVLNSNINTNIGNIPMEDYLDLLVQQIDYDDYRSYLENGHILDDYKTINLGIFNLNQELGSIFEYLVFDPTQVEEITLYILSIIDMEYAKEYSGYSDTYLSSLEINDKDYEISKKILEYFD